MRKGWLVVLIFNGCSLGILCCGQEPGNAEIVSI